MTFTAPPALRHHLPRVLMYDLVLVLEGVIRFLKKKLQLSLIIQ